MTRFKTTSPPGSSRGEAVRQRVLDAAERLLRDGKAEFSMRELAAAADVSFATPFNQFGSKAAIMHALSERRIETMIKRFAAAPQLSNAADRVRLAVGLAVEVMLEEPAVNRAVMGWVGTSGPAPGKVLAHSMALWSLALDIGEGLEPALQQEALDSLPRQLAFAFRGVLSFWTAGEVPDAALLSHARDIAASLLLRFIDR
jgi:AcrR family transcriptional regulator